MLISYISRTTKSLFLREAPLYQERLTMARLSVAGRQAGSRLPRLVGWGLTGVTLDLDGGMINVKFFGEHSFYCVRPDLGDMEVYRFSEDNVR